MSPEFVNLYIEKLITELTELTKINVLLRTHLAFSEQQVAALNKKLEERTHLAFSEQQVAALNKKLEEAEKLSAKKTKKSVEPAEQTF